MNNFNLTNLNDEKFSNIRKEDFFMKSKGINKKVIKILEESLDELNKSVFLQLLELTESEHDLFWLMEYAKGSALIKNPVIQKFKVIEHYYIPEKDCFLFILEKSKKKMYGFLLDDHMLVRYGTFSKQGFKQFLCSESIFVGMTVRELLDVYDIPDAEQIPNIYHPF